MIRVVRYISAVMLALVAGFSALSCTDEPHDGGRGIAVGIDRSECPDVTISVITVTITADDGSYETSRTFTDTKQLGATLFDVPPGCYTVTATTPEGISGKVRTCIDDGDVCRVVIRLSEEGREQHVLRLAVVLPDGSLPPFEGKTRSGEGSFARRVVADVFGASGGGRVLRRELTADIKPGGTVVVDLPLDEGTYDVRLWSDYVEAEGGRSPFYCASNLQQVGLVTNPYVACTDCKDAAYAYLKGVDVADGGNEVGVMLERPLAKYRIVANDIDRYRRMENVPDVKYLTVGVACEGFFPSSFNVVTGKPNNAVEGVSYTVRPAWTTDAEGQTELASDYVMVNGTESSVRLTVSIMAPDGSVVSRTHHVDVPYRRGRLTTVSGNFLTAGHGSGGVDIDTSWDDGTFEVEF